MHLSSPQLCPSLLLLGLTGCVSQARVSPAVDGDTLVRREKVELAGNPEVGTIIHIRQLHRVGVDRAPAEIDRYQAEIEQELQRLGLPDVFVEVTPSPGGAEAYAKSRPGVFLHPAMTREEKAQLYTSLHLTVPELMDLNESFAPPHVLAFLGENPGARVPLVFGAGHYFADNLVRAIPDPSRRPVLITVCWEVPESWELAPLINPHCQP